jgi:hypothetical protein
MEGEEPTIRYGDGGENDGATFARVCPRCHRFVKADGSVTLTYDGPPANKPNATCRAHGRVEMPFIGYY